MKILFLGDYSNLHSCLASEMRKRGHEVCVVSDGGRYLKTESDILLDREPGFSGSLKYLFRIMNLLPSWKNYDVVQIINPHFLNLRPGKIKYFYDKLRDQNRSIFLTLASDDYYFCKACLDGEMFRFSEFAVGKQPTEFETSTHRARGWTAPDVEKLNRHIYSTINGAMSVLPEYDMAGRPVLGERLKFTNLPVDLSYLPYQPLEIKDKLKFFVGIRAGMELQKGTASLLATAMKLAEKYPDRCEVECVRNLPLQEYLKRMRGAHIVLDQLYSYSPATNALQAMAQGRVAGSGGQDEYYSYIGEKDIRPVINLSPLIDVERELEKFVDDPSPLYGMSRQGREIVERHNDLKLVADSFEQHWKNML